MSLLEGVKVLELSSDAGVSACGRVLAGWKAKVLKIEIPQEGDRYDRRPDLSREVLDECKESVSIDLKTGEGQSAFYRLLEETDVFLTGFTCSTSEWTVPDYEYLSSRYPRLIYASLSAYGSKGKLSGTKGTGAVSFWARSGFSGFFGEPDAPPVSTMPGMDAMVTGTFLANGIVAALIGRNQTNRGEKVEISMYHSAIWAAGHYNATSNYWENPKKTRKKPDAPLINSFNARDGKWFYTAIMEHERHWPLLCECIDRPELADDERYSIFRNAAAATSDLTALLDEAFAKKDREEWLKLFKEKDIPAGAIFNASEVLNDVQAVENGYIEGISDKDGLRVYFPAPPTHFTEGE